jgi:class 3 adenylate cyclase
MIAACGAKTICSTCRLEVIEGLECLEPRGEAEERIAKRLGWDETIRLGCATKFSGEGIVKIRRLIKPPREKKQEKRHSKQNGLGSIRALAILFVDLRGFTPLSESIPAFDLVYILNRYYTALKEEIVKNKGTINLWAGDELSCVFGVNESPNSSYCEDAVQTAFAINKRIEILSRSLREEFNLGISVGVGVHYGPVVIGNLGPVDDLRFGIIGDAVNIASRLERKTRGLDCDILISSTVKDHLTVSASRFNDACLVELKGVSGSFIVHPLTTNPSGHRGLSGR